MKKIAGIFMITLLLTSYGFRNIKSAANVKQVTLTVEYSFLGIEEGYDHDCKTELYIDDKLVATSTVKKESEKNSVSTQLSKGIHKIKVINYALYKGAWEEHTIANNYSIDCLYESTLKMKKKRNKLKLVFDIDKGTYVE